jgi:hypothetical protein
MTQIINSGSNRFIDIPEYFLKRYDDEFNAWAANIRKIKFVKSFVLKEGHFADDSPDPEQGKKLMAVRIVCKPWSRGFEFFPLTEEDRKKIREHCDKMERLKIDPRMVLPEPERPWLPFMPRIGKPN